MHGSIQQEHASCRSLRRSCDQHMRSVLPLVTTTNTVVVQGDHHSSLTSSTVRTSTSDSFFKDGRKINVGDCALFKPPQDSPPFIGLIRWLSLSEENTLQLGVNWLYRATEIKLGKGTLVGGAPNEIFYSFHKDEIPAASLLHPCKVAFLPRAVGLPTGTSSFVCRRVYDIANKCLWWLTDQDYINERQEEVDKLLCNTRVEMHAPMQPGSRSPKQVNGPTSTSQVKPASDNCQNSGISSHSQMKGKKRERGDHGGEAVKRERCPRIDDSDYLHCKMESNLKSEIAQITEKGGLVDVDGVEKLIHFMQLDKTERKMDLANRSVLAGVVGSTDRADCLDRFVQLRGLPVLDEWLQDIHKGKIGDGNCLKDSDISVDEFLLVLLRALDKLPVNLQALQMCNIGRSVNHLRSHKNSEIQRKARSLVDTWKKRVEAEMISIDSKSGSTQGVSVWPSKSRLIDATHSGGRTPSGSDVAMKSSITQSSASKSASVRSSHGDSNIKSSTSSPGHIKLVSSPSIAKECLFRVPVGGSPDAPLIREDRSSSSNQSQNHSQSFLGKEEGKSTVASSAIVNKMSITGSRNRKTSGFPGISPTGTQKEISSARSSSANKTTTLEKLNQSTASGERVLDVAVTEGSSHKLIVKIPNRVRSPAQGVTGGSQEDSTYTCSRVSSPVLLDRHDQFDRALEAKSGVHPYNVTSESNNDPMRNSDLKDVQVWSADAAAVPCADEGQSMNTDDMKKSNEESSTNKLKSEKIYLSSYDPMSALMNCVRYSEVNSSPEDDVGMNLLASVAAGVMRSDLHSPTGSTEQITPAAEDAFPEDEAKSKSTSESNIKGDQNHFSSDYESQEKKQAVLDGSSWSQGGLHLAKDSLDEITPSHPSEDMFIGESNKLSDSSSTDVRCKGDPKREIYVKPNEKVDTTSLAPTVPAETLLGESNKLSDSSSTDVRCKADPKREIYVKPNEKVDTTSLAPTVPAETLRDGELNQNTQLEKGTPSNDGTDDMPNFRTCVVDGIAIEEKTSCGPLNAGDCKPIIEDLPLHPLRQSESKRDTKEDVSQIACREKAASEVGNDNRLAPDEKGTVTCASKSERLSFDMEVDRNTTGEIQSASCVCSVPDEVKNHHRGVKVKNKTLNHVLVPNTWCPGSVDHETLELGGSNSATIQLEDGEKGSALSNLSEASSAAGASEFDIKVEFDLNERFSADDVKYGESVSLFPSGVTHPLHMMNSLAFSVNPIITVHSASVTVAAAGKGPFVPPEDLLRSKGELGWRGSAATSAFRPAEPRKVLETPLVSTSMSSPDTSMSKHGRITLDIDLNVPDERALEEMASRDSFDLKNDFVTDHAKLMNDASVSVPVRGSGGLDLDLNRVDDACDTGNCSTSGHHIGESSSKHLKPFDGLLTADSLRDLDLNNGPGVDDANTDQFSIHQQVKVAMPPHFSAVGLRMNSPAQGSFSSWFPAGNSYSTIARPSMLPDRGEHQFPVFPPNATHRTFVPSGGTSFTPEIYRGSVLPSSPAVPFPSSAFQFPLFPFGATYPLPSATFSVGATSYVDSSSGPRLFGPPVHTQLLGPVGSVTPQFHRPYIVGLTDSNNNGGLESNRRWGRQGFDLNAGPGAMESEVREEIFPLPSGQNSVSNSQALAEEQARMYSVSSSIVKRKEPPEGGWDNESFRFKQSSWQ